MYNMGYILHLCTSLTPGQKSWLVHEHPTAIGTIPGQGITMGREVSIWAYLSWICYSFSIHTLHQWTAFLEMESPMGIYCSIWCVWVYLYQYTTFCLKGAPSQMFASSKFYKHRIYCCMIHITKVFKSFPLKYHFLNEVCTATFHIVSPFLIQVLLFRNVLQQ